MQPSDRVGGTRSNEPIPAIEASDVHKTYGGLVAVGGLSLTVLTGEVFALLGPNGAGKTTTVEILEGHRQPDSGSVRVLGVDPWRANRRFRERIGVVLQSGGIDGDLTVRETVALFADLYPRRREVDEVMTLVGLSRQARQHVRWLSGGQLRRLDLALALVGDPEVIFLDEPTTGFDPSARHQAWELVAELRRLGKTILLTSHYMDEVQHLADRVAVMSKGRVVAESTPNELGGRDAGEAIISFQEPYPGWHGELQAGPWTMTVTDAHEVRITTAKPTETLAAVTAWAHDRGEELIGLTVTRPSLEDAYLHLTTVNPPVTGTAQ
jgi:ABC-2 type transport system ATP-binding protein